MRYNLVSLKELSYRVTWFKHFTLQQVRLPCMLHASAYTERLAYRIELLTKELRESVEQDYQRQKADILSRRKALAEAKKEFDRKTDKA